MARERIEKRTRMTNIRREQLFDKCKGVCLHCGCDLTLGDNFSIEHIIPLSKGGTNDFDNTVALCKDCNFEKGDDVVEAEFYRYAPKVVYEKIEKLLDDYHERTDWLTERNVFKHDRYTFTVQQSIFLPNGRPVFRDAEVEFKKMPFEEYLEFINNFEQTKRSDFRFSTESVELLYKNQTPYKVTFKGKAIASLLCGLNVQDSLFGIFLTVSKDANWGPSSRFVIVECIHKVLDKFKESVEEKGTKGAIMCVVDSLACDKRASSVVDYVSEIWGAETEVFDVEEHNATLKRVCCATSFNIEIETEDGIVDGEEFYKKSKLYSGQLKRRVKQNG